MAVSNDTGYRQEGAFWRRLFGQLTRYDLLLAVIPLVFALALAAHALVGVSLEAALGVAAVASTACLADAVYFHPPIDSSDS